MGSRAMLNLSGKKALITGVANKRSIAWAIAQAMHEAGCELAFTYQTERLEAGVRKLGDSLGVAHYYELDVTNEAHFTRLAKGLEGDLGSLDYALHSIAFANKEAFDNPFHEISETDFLQAHQISAYSLIPLCRSLRHLLGQGDGGSVLAMTYFGAEKVVPMYSLMGVAKASLEVTARYLANDLGPDGIRVNCLSAGPVRTLAAAGIPGFRELMRKSEHVMPLRRHITTEEVAHAAAFLLANTGITGEVTHVDAGFNILAAEGQGATD